MVSKRPSITYYPKENQVLGLQAFLDQQLHTTETHLTTPKTTIPPVSKTGDFPRNLFTDRAISLAGTEATGMRALGSAQDPVSLLLGRSSA